jgi:hypothetical protein
MATKTKAPVAVELVVRRGARGRYQKLKDQTAALPVKVSWDRRKTERRSTAVDAGTDRRKSDRRQAPPYTWDVSDFVVVAPAKRRR